MPYLTKYPQLNLWGDVVEHNIQFIMNLDGSLSNVLAPGTDSVVANGTGSALVTFGDAPYYQCVHASGALYEATPNFSSVLSVYVAPVVNMTGTTSVVTVYNFSGITNPPTPLTISLTYNFRQCPVP